MSEPSWSPPQWILPRPVTNTSLPDVPLPDCLRVTLARRGFSDNDQAQKFLSPCQPPNVLEHYPQLPRALSRIQKSIESKEAIGICGDYDADGMTSSAILFKALKGLKANVITAIPDRLEEGYGLNQNMINNLNDSKVKLIITVDNGINAHKAIDQANSLNIDVIITDHHKLQGKPPNAHSLIHPSTVPRDSPYEFLAGVGLAYVVAAELAKRYRNTNILSDALDLFCIGTIADMAPLTGCNRSILVEGLRNLHNTHCNGLIALYRLSGIRNRRLNSDDIGFRVAPKINAVGRIGDPQLILDLLVEEDENQAILLARQCDELNKKRKLISDGIESEAIAIIDSDKNSIPPFILLAQSHWHQGVIGLVASRILQRYQRPTALLAATNNGLFRASARGPEGFSVNIALDSCSDLLETHGGHSAAGGFTIKPENLGEFHHRMNNIAERWLINARDFISIKPDCSIKFSEINWELWRNIALFEPFGVENPKILFWSSNCKLITHKYLRGGHLRLELEQDGCKKEAFYWNYPAKTKIASLLDIAFHLSVNDWLDEEKLVLNIVDVREYRSETVISKSNRKYKCYKKNIDNNVIIVNSEGKEIEFSQNDNSKIVNMPSTLKTGSYISSLIREVRVALAIDH